MPDCGVRIERAPLLPRKAPFSKRFEDAVGQACESASARQVARRFELAESTGRAIDLRYLDRLAASGAALRPAAWACENRTGRALSNGQWAPRRRIVYDKFHVMQHANQGIAEVRLRFTSWRLMLAHLYGILNYCRTKAPLGVVEAVKGNIESLLRRGRGYENLPYLLL